MNLLSAITIDPIGIVLWLIVGAIAGWGAGMVMKGGSYGLVGDIVVGLIGAIVGGFLFGTFNVTTYGLLGSILVAFVGACVLIFVFRFVSRGRNRL